MSEFFNFLLNILNFCCGNYSKAETIWGNMAPFIYVLQRILFKTFHIYKFGLCVFWDIYFISANFCENRTNEINSQKKIKKKQSVFHSHKIIKWHIHYSCRCCHRCAMGFVCVQLLCYTQSDYRQVPRWTLRARHNWKCFLAYKKLKKKSIF